MTNSVASGLAIWNNDSTAGARTVNWNYRFDERASHLVQGTITAGDSFAVESIATGYAYDPATGAATDTLVTNYVPVNGSPFTANFNLVLIGPLAGVRITKTGTTGPATIITVG